jgi:copper(I)-binding protein
MKPRYALLASIFIVAPPPSIAAMPGIARLPVIVAPASQDRAASVAAPGPASAEYSLGALRIISPWMRATAKGATVAGAYFTITNTGSEPDRLLNITSDIATTVEVHEMSVTDNVMKMRPVEKPLEIEPGAVLEFKPNGYHLMFSRLKQGIKEGDKVKATMVFEKAGEIEIEFPAGSIAAMGPSKADQMHDHKM